MACNSLTFALSLAIAVGSSPFASARDRPGTPAEVTVQPGGPTSVQVSFVNTARRDEHVRFEIEQQVNGIRASRSAEQRLSHRLGTSGTGAAWSGIHGTTITDLQPETDYCFRLWSRVIDSDVRSDQPSAWTCTRTPPHPPLEPLDLAVAWPGIGARTPRVSWSTPDQSGHRRIDRYVIERQSPPGPNRPWILDTTVPGPAGAQERDTQLVFSTLTAPVAPAGRHLFRVCAENAGGRRCVLKELAPGAQLVGTSKSLPGISAVTKPAQAPVASVVVATPTAPAAASSGASERLTVSRGRTPKGAATASSTAPAPASTSGSPSESRAGTASQAGTQLRGGAQTAQGTRLVTRQGTTLHGAQAPMHVLDEPAKKPATSARGLGSAATNARASGAIDTQTLELRCRGGFDPARFERPPARQKPGTALATLTLRFNAHRREKHGPGFALEPGTCALVQRTWQTGDPPAVLFETARYEPPSVEQQQKRAQHGSAATLPTARDLADERSIPIHLAQPDQYWRFFVTRGDGYFFASRHEPWTPTHALQRANVSPRTPAGSGELELAIAKLTNVQVRPSVGGAAFRFIARPGAHPTIEIGSEAPLRGRDGLLILKKPSALLAEADTLTSGPAVTWYAANTKSAGIGLGQGVLYHYVITVPGDGTMPVQQSSGTVGTLEQVLKIRFETLHIVHDSDTNSSGEGAFVFCAGAPGHQPDSKWLMDEAFDTNSTITVGEELVFRRWTDGPLSIAVEGTEHDGVALGILFPFCGDVQAPYSNDMSDANVAHFTIDTAKNPQLQGARGISTFERESMPNAAFKFSVTGSIEILRPQPAGF